MADDSSTKTEEPKIELTEREKQLAAAPLVGASQGLSIVPEDPDTSASDEQSAAEPVSDDSSVDEPSEGVTASEDEDRFKEMAESLGIPLEEAKQFETTEELTRAVKWRDQQSVSDQQAMQQHYEQQYQAEMQAQEAGQSQQQSGQDTDSESSNQAAPKATELNEGVLSDFDPAKYEEQGFDEDTVSMAKDFKAALDGLKQQIDTQVSAGADTIEQAVGAARTQEALSFHDALDAMKDDRFGKTLDESGTHSDITDEQKLNRAKVGEQFVMLRDHMASQGHMLPAVTSLVRRARMQAFVEDIEKDTRKEVHNQIRRQTKRRISGPGNSRATSVTEDQNAETVANHPAMVELWDQFQEANSTS